MLEHNRVLAERASATPLACALAAAHDGRFGDTIVCVVSGGTIGLEMLADLLK
jgi:threonine dehydratase